MRLVLLHFPFVVLAAVAARHDGTLRLAAAGGRGLLEHYGYHALLLSAPLLLWLASRVLSQLASVVASPLYLAGRDADASATAFQRELLDVLACRTARARGLFVLFSFLGVVAVAANAGSTLHPELVYGEDVFDAFRHPWGYALGRLFLTYYWVGLLPLVAYIAVAATHSVFRIVLRVTGDTRYVLSSFAADGCGGFRALGSVMMGLVYLYVPLAVVIGALSLTHTNTYETLIVATLLMAVMIVGHVVVPFVHLHRLLARLKRQKLQHLEQELTVTEFALRSGGGLSGGAQATSLYLALLAGDTLYRQTSALSTWPYLPSDRLRWLAPLVPIVVSAAVKKLAGTP